LCPLFFFQYFFFWISWAEFKNGRMPARQSSNQKRTRFSKISNLLLLPDYIYIYFLPDFFPTKSFTIIFDIFFSLIFFTNNFLRLFKKYAILCMWRQYKNFSAWLRRTHAFFLFFFKDRHKYGIFLFTENFEKTVYTRYMFFPINIIIMEKYHDVKKHRKKKEKESNK